MNLKINQLVCFFFNICEFFKMKNSHLKMEKEKTNEY